MPESRRIKILSEYGVQFSEKNPASKRCLEKLGNYTPQEVATIGKVLKEKEAAGNVKTVAGLLVQDPGICKKILSGKFYPEYIHVQGKKMSEKPDWKRNTEEFELYVPPHMYRKY